VLSSTCETGNRSWIDCNCLGLSGEDGARGSDCFSEITAVSKELQHQQLDREKDQHEQMLTNMALFVFVQGDARQPEGSETCNFIYSSVQ